ncbi:MAG: nuclear transport factor 2 family protein [Ottowia sp.]|nr:nuclear transport factor 2 family protein [Ottowia sp.]
MKKISASHIITSGFLVVTLWSLCCSAVAQENKTLTVQATTSTQATAVVWQRHIAAWDKRDLDAIMSDYAENTVLILNNKIYEGRTAVRKVFERLFQIFDQGKNKIDTPIIKDRIVYITWHFSLRSNKTTFFGTDTFVIENNAISYQTIASPLYEKYAVATPDM